MKRMTSETVDFYGFKDRGRLQPGLKADVNVIDVDGLNLHSPKMIFDLPAGGRRLVQSVDGYDMTICFGRCSKMCRNNRIPPPVFLNPTRSRDSVLQTNTINLAASTLD